VLLLVLLVQVMGAGHETTATTTAAALYCISAHPAVEQQLVAELQSVLGARAPTYEDLEHLPYLQVWFGPHGALLLLLLLSILDFALKLLCLFAIMILRQWKIRTGLNLGRLLYLQACACYWLLLVISGA
jgi:hypothetical protein